LNKFLSGEFPIRSFLNLGIFYYPNMPIRDLQEKDFSKLATLYLKFFPTHNIFQQHQDIVGAYLRKESLEREAFLVHEEKGKVTAALILVLEGKSADKSHTRWKFRHFAFSSETAGEKLLREAEKRVQKSSQTAKVELTIAESEPGAAFYKKHGYAQEGILKNHYRWGERCFVLGKSFS